MKKQTISLTILLACTTAAQAFTVQYGNTVTISQRVNEDVYVAGGTVIINAPIYGDLVVLGGTVSINDSVMNDILLAGGTVTFNGYVGDDVRCAGGQLHVTKDINGHMAVSGGQVTIGPGVTVNSMMVSGGEVNLNGRVKGILKGIAATLILNGPVDGDVDVRAGTLEVNSSISGKAALAADKLTIGSQAAFLGEVRYWTPDGKADFKNSARNGAPRYDESLAAERKHWYYFGYVTAIGLFIYLGSAFLIILLTQYFFSASMRRASLTVSAQPVRSLGAGFLFLLAVPVAAVLALATLVGIPIGLLLLFAYILLLIFALGIIAVVLANWFSRKRAHRRSNGQMAALAFALFIALRLVSFLPFLGWVIVLLLTCLAFGALLLNVRLPKRSLSADQSGSQIPEATA